MTPIFLLVESGLEVESVGTASHFFGAEMKELQDEFFFCIYFFYNNRFLTSVSVAWEDPGEDLGIGQATLL